MTMFNPTAFLWFVVTAAGIFSQMATQILANLEPPSVRACELQRAYRMLGYSCANLNLREVPQHLKADVGILDLSFNRIRELSPRSFQHYEDIRLLYLFENMIQTIEANTFSRMRDLEAIDLSTNGLSTIPKELFDLPLLRNLHVSHNNLHHLTYDLTLISKPISAPLEVISLSKCKLSNIPNFGPLPDLLLLNVSQNDLVDLTPDSLAPLCSLKMIDLNETETPRCMCYQVKKYLNQHHVNISGTINCDANHPHPGDALDSLTYCAETNTPLTLVEHELFEQCSGLVQTREFKEQSRRTWLWIVLGLAGFMVIFMCVLYGLHRRNVKAQCKSKLALNNRRPSRIQATTLQGGGTSSGALPLDVVAGNDEQLLSATTKV